MSFIRIFLSLMLCSLLIACEEEPEPGIPAPPVSKQVLMGKQDAGNSYTIEMSIPWSLFDMTIAENTELGFDLFLIDDDNGGLADYSLAWESEELKETAPIPANFGSLTLLGAGETKESGKVIPTEERILIDGKMDQAWENAFIHPIAKAVRGSSTTERDFSGDFRALWDNSALYIFAELRDDTLSVDSYTLSWEDDGLELYIDPGKLRSPELNEEEVFAYRVLRNSRMVFTNDFPVPPIWSVPVLQIFDGGPGKDGIPALMDPRTSEIANASYLRENDLILGYAEDGEARAYPHRILDWHEIINDELNSENIVISYCPLTGTGIGWNQEMNGIRSTFGVSGLLHNSNLIPYDRLTDSNWSQMRLDCLSGALQGRKLITLPLVETTWKTWKEMFPNTKVVSQETGYSRNYEVYPYGDYRTNNESLIFPVNHENDQLPKKERVHGIIMNKEAQVYPFSSFPGNGITLIQDEFQNNPIVVAGSSGQNFIVSFGRKLADGTLLSFSRLSQSPEDPSIIMQDQEGNQWNLLGKAISGPRTGAQLPRTDSYIGYYFAFVAFFPELTLR